MTDAPKTRKTKAVAVIDPAPASDSHSVMRMIDKVLAHKEIPVETLERMFALHKDMLAHEAQIAAQNDFAAMSQEMPSIKKTGKILNKQDKVQSRYAKWEDICDTILPIVHKHNFALNFNTDSNEVGMAVVTAVLKHAKGHIETSRMVVPVDMSGSKNAIQGIGSAISYGKRYTAAALLNLVFTDEDDDGVSAGVGTLTPEQQAKITALIEATKTDQTRFLKYYKAERLADIPVTYYDHIVATLTAKQAEQIKRHAAESAATMDVVPESAEGEAT